MACYALYFAILYFGVSPASTYEMLYFSMFLRGLGMMILVIAFGLFVVEDLEPKIMLTNAFFVIAVRSAFAPVIGVSFYNNMLYSLRLKALHRLSDGISLADPLAAVIVEEANTASIMQPVASVFSAKYWNYSNTIPTEIRSGLLNKDNVQEKMDAFVAAMETE